MEGFVAEFFGEYTGDSNEPALSQPQALCGLSSAQPLADVSAANGLVVTIDGQVFDLGIAGANGADVADGGSITLADDRGLSIYADVDGDGAVDHVTTMLYDGSWQTWHVQEDGGAEDGGAEDGGVGTQSEESAHHPAHHTNEGEKQNVTESTSPRVGHWDAYAWEQEGRGKWR